MFRHKKPYRPNLAGTVFSKARHAPTKIAAIIWHDAWSCSFKTAADLQGFDDPLCFFIIAWHGNIRGFSCNACNSKKIGNKGKALHDTGFEKFVTTASCLIDSGYWHYYLQRPLTCKWQSRKKDMPSSEHQCFKNQLLLNVVRLRLVYTGLFLERWGCGWQILRWFSRDVLAYFQKRLFRLMAAIPISW